MRDNFGDLYFEWLYDMMCSIRYGGEVSYRKLLTYLHSVEFRYFMLNDENRASDGKELRYRFLHYRGCDADEYDGLLDEPCSVLEMMVALAIRCEENIMDNPEKGNRTTQWFWGMINSLGLGTMMDSRFDEEYVANVINRFMDRKYAPNGRGGLFTINECDRDLRDVEIWYQLCWYLDAII